MAEIYRTKDSHLAAALHALGLDVEELEKVGKITFYHFALTDGEDIESYERKYHLRDLKVDAKTLFESWDTIRQMYQS